MNRRVLATIAALGGIAVGFASLPRSADAGPIRTCIRLEDSDEDVWAFAVYKSGCGLVTGRSHAGTAYTECGGIMYAPNGVSSWMATYKESANLGERAHAIAEGYSCNVYVAGLSHNSLGVSKQPEPAYAPGAQTGLPHRNNLGLDFGTIPAEDYYMFAITYSHRINANWRRGISLSYSFEDNISTFNNNLYDVFSLELHQRYQRSEWYHIDLGLVVFVSGSVDGGSGAKFAGLYAGAGVGWKFLFIGCNVRAGLASGNRGSEFGVVVRPLIRLVIGF